MFLYTLITIVNILLYLHYHIFYIYVIYKNVYIVKSVHCQVCHMWLSIAQVFQLFCMFGNSSLKIWGGKLGEAELIWIDCSPKRLCQFVLQQQNGRPISHNSPSSIAWADCADLFILVLKEYLIIFFQNYFLIRSEVKLLIISCFLSIHIHYPS